MASNASAHFWIGQLSTTVAIASQTVRDQPKAAQKDLRSCLAEFIASPVPSEELREILRPYLERGTR
jgi:hypothetical protein